MSCHFWTDLHIMTQPVQVRFQPLTHQTELPKKNFSMEERA
ncbi:hypothetical protein SAMN06265361_10222 [Laceyella tengchongensis]|uniref:Uncharacterized protein n=1 Tax=Laceyella tengchongensis TaxID=574699 RepID=A0AA45WKT5_9BACL|nr:hypothetical protein SAMN06265361_10222 [Laceyella tengchongensis]